jgi:regulatory protein YycI of two-component signal transduction system YycFG
MQKKYIISILIVIFLIILVIIFKNSSKSNNSNINESNMELNVTVDEVDPEKYIVVDDISNTEVYQTQGEGSAEIFNYDSNFNPDPSGELKLERENDSSIDSEEIVEEVE